MNAISIKNVNKIYPNGQKALKNFSLEVGEGEIFGFLGPNGAGKTTTIKILLGLLNKDSGTVAIYGKDPLIPKNRRALGYLPEVANYYEFMKADELLHYYGVICGLDKQTIRQRIKKVLTQVDLQGTANKRLKHFSKGMLQRVGIAQALLHDPQVLILDEPTTGLDPLARLQMRDIILQLRTEGKTVFFSSHELSEAETVCDRVGIIKQGSLCWCGPAKEVVGEGNENLERIFLNIITSKQQG